MAETKNAATQDQAKSEATQRMAAARAARRNGKGTGRELSDEEKFAVRNVQLAAKACKIVGQRIRDGKLVPPKVLEACAILSGSLSDMLYS